MFHHEMDKKNMMRGFTPFCLQKMDKVNRIAMKQLEERLNDATHRSFNDLTKKETMRKFSPINDTLSFVTAISNTYALAWALSPKPHPSLLA